MADLSVVTGTTKLLTEMTVELPAGASDRTVDRAMNVFILPCGESRVSFVVARDELLVGEVLDLYVSRTLSALTEGLPGFELIERKTSDVDGAPCCVIDSRFQSKSGPIFQRQTMLIWGGRALTLTFSGLAEDVRSKSADILSTVRLRSPKIA
jgi:hypothetical protein